MCVCVCVERRIKEIGLFRYCIKKRKENKYITLKRMSQNVFYRGAIDMAQFVKKIYMYIYSHVKKFREYENFCSGKFLPISK